MTPFLTHTGTAARLDADNIDTDQIIPSREMKTVSKRGLGAGLFAAQRYLPDPTAGEPVANPDFVLNRPGYEDATILIAGRNFGCGSSREHAVWALVDYGIRAVIAESFGEIFHSNCIRNGVLPVALAREVIDRLPRALTIDLPAQTVDGHPFDIAPGDKAMLVEGLDTIALTQAHAEWIEAWFSRDRVANGWKYPG